MTKRSVYVDHHTHDNQDSKRLTVVPGQSKYLFVYPFMKTREWFLLKKAARQGMMDEHTEVGRRFPSVKLNTSHSFGLDDQAARRLRLQNLNARRLLAHCRRQCCGQGRSSAQGLADLAMQDLQLLPAI